MAGRVGDGIRPMALGLARVLCLGAARAVVAAQRAEIWCTCAPWPAPGARWGRGGAAAAGARGARAGRPPGGCWRVSARVHAQARNLRSLVLGVPVQFVVALPRLAQTELADIVSTPYPVPAPLPCVHQRPLCLRSACCCPVLPRARARRDAGARMLALCMLLFCVCALRAWLYGPALRTLASTCCAFGVPVLFYVCALRACLDGPALRTLASTCCAFDVPVQFCSRPATVGAPRKALADIVYLPT